MYSQVALGDSSSAMRTVKSILKLDENNYAAYLQLGGCYYAEKNYARALSCYQKLNKLYPEDLAAASGMAWALIGTNDYEAARPLFDYILMVSPGYSYAAEGRKLCKQVTQSKDQK
jgi:tetratricopeptide (TPR) repeat protein